MKPQVKNILNIYMIVMYFFVLMIIFGTITIFQSEPLNYSEPIRSDPYDDLIDPVPAENLKVKFFLSDTNITQNDFTDPAQFMLDGTGTLDSPFLLQNFVFNLTNFSIGIDINSFSYHLKILNCTFHSSRWSVIRFQNIESLTVDNCTFWNNSVYTIVGSYANSFEIIKSNISDSFIVSKIFSIVAFTCNLNSFQEVGSIFQGENINSTTICGNEVVSQHGNFCILIYQYDSLAIKDNHIQGRFGKGISIGSNRLTYMNKAILLRNYIEDCKVGISIKTKNILIQGSILKNCTVGIEISETDYLELYDSEITASQEYGIIISGLKHGRIERNNIIKSQKIGLLYEELRGFASSSNLIAYNTVLESGETWWVANEGGASWLMNRNDQGLVIIFDSNLKAIGLVLILFAFIIPLYFFIIGNFKKLPFHDQYPNVQIDLFNKVDNSIDLHEYYHRLAHKEKEILTLQKSISKDFLKLVNVFWNSNQLSERLHDPLSKTHIYNHLSDKEEAPTKFDRKTGLTVIGILVAAIFIIYIVPLIYQSNIIFLLLWDLVIIINLTTISSESHSTAKFEAFPFHFALITSKENTELAEYARFKTQYKYLGEFSGIYSEIEVFNDKIQKDFRRFYIISFIAFVMMVVLEVWNYIVQWNQYLLALSAILNIGLLITLAIYYWKVGQFNHYQKGLAYLQSVNRADTTDAIPT